MRIETTYLRFTVSDKAGPGATQSVAVQGWKWFKLLHVYFVINNNAGLAAVSGVQVIITQQGLTNPVAMLTASNAENTAPGATTNYTGAVNLSNVGSAGSYRQISLPDFTLDVDGGILIQTQGGDASTSIQGIVMTICGERLNS